MELFSLQRNPIERFVYFMAEAPAPAPAPAPPKSKQYIKASVDDNALEPDALRGSEQVIKDAGVTDDEEERRKVYKEEKK